MGKKAILCIDDEPAILNSLKTQLKRNFGNNYTYETAEDAAEALELIEELVTDGISILVIISDWLMPGMKGDDFLIEVHSRHPFIIKIMLTGHANEDAVERAKKYANLFRRIHKPWQENELVDTIREALQNFEGK